MQPNDHFPLPSAQVVLLKRQMREQLHRHTMESRDARQVYTMEMSEARRTLNQYETRVYRLESDNKATRAAYVRCRAASQANADEARDLRRAAELTERHLRVSSLRILSLERQLALYRDSAVPRCEHEKMTSQLASRIDELEARVHDQEQMIKQLRCHEQGEGEESEGDVSEHEVEGEGDGDGDGEGAMEKKSGRWGPASSADRLRQSIGVGGNRMVPPREFKGDDSKRTAMWNWAKLATRHIAAVIEGRPMEHIMVALARRTPQHPTGRLHELAEHPLFAAEVKIIVRSVVGCMLEHWTARLSVNLWDRLELSRAKMETLRHLLSFVYDPVRDKYDQIIVWRHPLDASDAICMPCIVGRFGREKLFNELADGSNIVVGANGRCERDVILCVQQVYSRFRQALRDDFTPHRPAQPILYFDGTGGSLGKGICHAEIGTADFKGDCMQSRSTLSPAALFQGNDHALPLRENVSFMMGSFNKLSEIGAFERDDGEEIPCQPIVVGDMQGVKCIMGMAESCHAVWCKCSAMRQLTDGVTSTTQHKYGDADFKSYEEMVSFIDELGCEFKSEDFLLACAHLSKGSFFGGKFTAFQCPCCLYAPTRAQYMADLHAFHSMTDLEQKAARKAHVALGEHSHVELYMGPMTRGFGMERVGVDQLHLVYLNMFKHIFKYTVHEALPVSKQKIVNKYLKEAGFYSYDADDDSDDPVKRWIGREVKRFLHEADLHLPFLLQMSSSDIDVEQHDREGEESMYNAQNEEQMDISDDDDFAPNSDEVRQEADAPSLAEANSARWDRFLDWVRLIETSWEEDTDEYRKHRALLFCNAARACARDLLELKPTLQSWVPHIACYIVPRQIVLLGDPSRRSADACESFGACCKKTIKFLTCRRRLTAQFKRGYVEQAFRRLVVRADKLLGNAENAVYAQRSDHKLLRHGRSSNGRDTKEGPALSVRFKVEMEMADA